MSNAIDILKKSDLSITESRIQILGFFLATEEALAHADIEKLTKTDIDRVTVYRTLQTFVDRGIIHRIPTGDNSIMYALCRHACEKGHHKDDHVHFICDSCEKTICLEAITVPKVRLPRGFKSLQSSMIVSGICSNCC
jgi:Fur family ferric uptake transcriptional regulator